MSSDDYELESQANDSLDNNKIIVDFDQLANCTLNDNISKEDLRNTAIFVRCVSGGTLTVENGLKLESESQSYVYQLPCAIEEFHNNNESRDIEEPQEIEQPKLAILNIQKTTKVENSEFSESEFERARSENYNEPQGFEESMQLDNNFDDQNFYDESDNLQFGETTQAALGITTKSASESHPNYCWIIAGIVVVIIAVIICLSVVLTKKQNIYIEQGNSTITANNSIALIVNQLVEQSLSSFIRKDDIAKSSDDNISESRVFSAQRSATELANLAKAINQAKQESVTQKQFLDLTTANNKTHSSLKQNLTIAEEQLRKIKDQLEQFSNNQEFETALLSFIESLNQQIV